MGLNEEIEDVREKLNEMLEDRELHNYGEVLDISMKLDKLIYKYYENKKIT